MKYNKNHTAYYNDAEIEVPSVTTVLQILNKPFLSKWANILGFKRQKVEDVLQSSANIGTLVHGIVYAYLMKHMYMWTGTDMQEKFKVLSYFNNFISWKKAHDVEPIFMEEKFICDEFGGTVDFYGRVDGKLTILDFKTSKKAYASMFLQLAAYCYMLELKGYEVEQVAIININETKYQEKFLPREKLDRYIRIFRLLTTLFHQWYDVNIEDGWGNILDK